MESALALDIRHLAKLDQLHDGARGSLTWSSGASVSFTVTLQGDIGTLTLFYTAPDRDTGERKNVACAIPLSSLPLHYGGYRWYMHCPRTGRRAQILHKWNGLTQFCHRSTVHPKPTYASQRISGSDRIMAQRWAIRRKLGDTSSDLFGEPCKPKRMRWRTFEHYANRDAELAERESGYLRRLIGRLQGMR
ncbi:hypothetical protein [Dyella tabacisoli]|uniref:Uncharacterized protein n=1 Tax=Dyella tabacisoli TaxID=2282381 RepID=A0A369UQZ8_9GAMM|nr:hypothetical protein [Dyella tabacisoli]RDD83192.1 hypothetical protein DVJ77_00875 [Dyella tabacisoli]